MESKENKTNPFSVPENYFDTFGERLSRRIEAERQEKVSVPGRVWQVVRPQIALAAVITGFALIGYLGLRTFISHETEWLTNEEIALYMEYYQDDFADYYLLGLLEHNEFYFEDIGGDETWYFDDPETYIEYLYQDDIPLDLIYTEF